MSSGASEKYRKIKKREKWKKWEKMIFLTVHTGYSIMQDTLSRRE
jgi:hypothetical protein